MHKPRLLSDNASSYIAGDLVGWLKDQAMDNVRDAPLHKEFKRIAIRSDKTAQSFKAIIHLDAAVINAR